MSERESQLNPGELEHLQLADVAQQYYLDDLTQEQEELNKLREMPYHMHINLELLECVYLVSAMLMEVPYMAGESPRGPGRRRWLRLVRHDQHILFEVFTAPPRRFRGGIQLACECGDSSVGLYR